MAISKFFPIIGSQALFVVYLEFGETTPHVIFIHPNGETLLLGGGDVDAIGSQLFDGNKAHESRDYPYLVMNLGFGEDELNVTIQDGDRCKFVCKNQYV